MKVSKHFKPTDFDCRCGKCTRPQNVPSDELVDILDELWDSVAPITINSAYRCPEHNAKVGGAPRSQHTIGSAADITAQGVNTEELHNIILSKYGERQLGIAIKRNPKNPKAGFVHIDTRGKKARWTY